MCWLESISQRRHTQHVGGSTNPITLRHHAARRMGKYSTWYTEQGNMGGGKHGSCMLQMNSTPKNKIQEAWLISQYSLFRGVTRPQSNRMEYTEMTQEVKRSTPRTHRGGGGNSGKLSSNIQGCTHTDTKTEPQKDIEKCGSH